MGKVKSLLKDISALAISNFGSRLISFLLIPIYTSVLTTEEYGNYDIIYTTVSLLVPVLTLGITDGVTRFLLESKERKSDIYKVALRIILLSVVVVIIFSVINNITGLLPIFKDYWFMFVSYYVVFVLYRLAQDVARGLDKLKLIGISGVINSVCLLVLNMLFLLVFNWKLNGFFLANIFSNMIAASYIIILVGFHKEIKIKNVDRKLRREMIKYSGPMVLNSVGWWINSVSDRYIVTLICGVAANGIYSIAYKIPTVLTSLQSIFNQAWTVSLVKDYDRKKSHKFVQDAYDTYNVLMMLACVAIIYFNRLIARLLYADDFFEAWQYAPVLVLSVLFSSLSGLLGAIFGAEKDTKVLGQTTTIGAIVNIVLNVVLINGIGVFGAAIATLISSIVVWAMRYMKSQKYIRLDRSSLINNILSYFVIIIQVWCAMMLDELYLYGVQLILIIIIVLLNRSSIRGLISKGIMLMKGNK